MSGRTRHLRDGELITNRKTDRRQAPRTPSHLMPDWVLRFPVPPTARLLVPDSGSTGMIGVSITQPGPYVQVAGKDQQWVLEQGAKYLGSIASGLELQAEAKLTRDGYPRAGSPEAPWHPNERRSLCLVYVPGPSVVIPRAMDPAMVVAISSSSRSA